MTRRPNVIAIIGGGASGVLTAAHLLRTAPAASHVMIIEPRPELGRGIAYGSTDLGHLLNVRAGRMSALPEDPDHFTAWARRHTDADSGSFLPRFLYGEYLVSVVGPVEHVRSVAVDVAAVGSRTEITLSDGSRRLADRVVLALGSSPVWPEALTADGSRWISDPWAPGALADLSPDDPVLLVGTGLTAIDVATSLHGAGHRQIVATSRHGLLPGTHPYEPFGPLHLDPPKQATARSLVAWARACATEVGDWAPVVDALRSHTDRVWGELADADRVQLLRHCHRRWEVIRHRMAPSVGAHVQSMLGAGHLTVVPGGVTSARTGRGGIKAVLADRSLRFGAVVNCTGPSIDVRRSGNPLVRRLLTRGVVRPGPLALGIDSDERGCLPDSGGALWLVGPLRRGRQWETTAVPEIRMQAADLSHSMWPLKVLVGA